ncbi:biotin--[acetyl-CoA-carboxylase] ligase [Novosphingobium mangrovi (ex Huang et al. 2023)]|uniref:biotin--[biotin carboxyl-carrier protein] ligase n=1 Tax=Novosphingobium mangrovi (ex Huang et al. 2023) TaxID=2976432 RepID=A0ABT2I3X1_9SPHN|nr:biotin--[acetyl-CoA-carboxylase] ligase [Novosphingobium mangrovi (ex Huang et al. 2023)]MCT2399504.1 biotin--[acetyl-CoA-carboxylase] ligase [Novosphingobium mangrovi (ex Huang et al. 2023)]
MIRIVEETGSTNADLAARLSGREYLPEGEWLVADRQTAGRGRLGRVWNDGAGNFMGSTVVRPGPGDPPASTLALMAGLAVHEAVAKFLPYSAQLWLKWPNDLLLDGAKVAGILLEMTGGVVIVGIGVNLVAAPEVPGRKIAALADYAPPPGRDVFAETLAAEFAVERQRWRTAGLAPLLRRWQSAAHPMGTRLTVLPPGEEALEGSYAGLSEDGNLLLGLADGTLRTIHAGDVLLASAPH